MGNPAHVRAVSPYRGFLRKTDMNFTQRMRGTIRAIAIALSLALPLVAAASSADARIGGGIVDRDQSIRRARVLEHARHASRKIVGRVEHRNDDVDRCVHDAR